MTSPKTKHNYSGLGFGFAAFTLFAIIPMYVQLLKPLSGFTLLNQRILWSSLLLVVALFFMGKLASSLRPMKNLRAWPGLIAGSLLVGLQWGIFVWAPLNGQTLDLSLGYFLVPLVMVFIGRVFLKEKLSPLKWLAIVCATFGVVMAFLQSNGLSWVVVCIAIGYPVYLMLRRIQVLSSASSFLIENLILLPVALVGILLYGGFENEAINHPFAYGNQWLLLFLGLAIVGSVPMLCFIAANKRLSMSTLGLIGYIEPVLIFVVAYAFLGETIKTEDIWTYGPIMLALGVLALDGV